MKFVAVIPDSIRYPWFDRLTMTGHCELVEGLDSGLRRAGMTGETMRRNFEEFGI